MAFTASYAAIEAYANQTDADAGVLPPFATLGVDGDC
jgi:hypothetical protein